MCNSKNAIPLIQQPKAPETPCAHIWVRYTASKRTFVKLKKCAICGVVVEA